MLNNISHSVNFKRCSKISLEVCLFGILCINCLLFELSPLVPSSVKEEKAIYCLPPSLLSYVYDELAIYIINELTKLFTNVYVHTAIN